MRWFASLPGITFVVLLLTFLFLGLAIWRTPAAIGRKDGLLDQFRQNQEEAIKEYERGRQ